MNDEALMALVAEGDERAFARLVDRHLPRAYAIARRVLHDQADAEDAAQEAFSRVWTHAGRFDVRRARFTTWFQRILVNRCLDQLRRAGHRPEQAAEDWLAELADPQADVAADVQRAREAEQVRRAVLRLPERQRMAVVLCYFEAQTNPEAARAMGLHVKALEGLLGRAREQLRRWLPGSLANETGIAARQERTDG